MLWVTLSEEPDVDEADVDEPDVDEPDVAEPDVAEADVAEPDVSSPMWLRRTYKTSLTSKNRSQRSLMNQDPLSRRSFLVSQKFAARRLAIHLFHPYIKKRNGLVFDALAENAPKLHSVTLNKFFPGMFVEYYLIQGVIRAGK